MSCFRFHPDIDDSFDPYVVPNRVVNLAGARERFGDAVDRYTPFLMQGDPLADELVNELKLYEWAPGSGSKLFDQALIHGIDSVDNPPPVLENFFRSVERVPPWVDWNQLQLAGEVLIRPGALSLLAVAFGGLIFSYGSPAGNKPLMHTEKLLKFASKRLSETGEYMLQVCLPGGLLRGHQGYELSIRSRITHANVRRMLLRSDWWKVDDWGIPINQLDLCVTNIQFSVMLVRNMRKLGVVITQDEEDAVINLWRYAGLLMGVNRELIVTSSHEADRISEFSKLTNGLPDEDSEELVSALLGASQGIFQSNYQLLSKLSGDRMIGSIARHLVGMPLADNIGLKANGWDAMVPLMRMVVLSQSLLTRLQPDNKKRRFENGRLKWEEVLAELEKNNEE